MMDARQLLDDLEELSARHARTLGREVAADLAAEALVRGLRSPPPDGRFRPWVERILRNLIIDQWRSRRRPWGGSEEPVPSPEALALARERRRLVRRSLRRLPPDLRRALVLRYYLEADGPAVAQREGISMATVRTRVHRGLARLRRMLGRVRGLATVPIGWLAPALQPAAVAVLLLAQQTPARAPAAAPPAPPSSPAHASPRAQEPAAPPPRPAVVVRRPSHAARLPVRRYDFEDDVVAGDLQRPDEVVVRGGRKTPQPSLIDIPGSMRAALLESVEEL
jgi:RNA polymerase sigma factor (sigma-70 family)